MTSEGVYKIDYALLQKAGINPAQVSPKNIRIYAGQPGMLPQPNGISRVKDLTEISISVSGEEDGKFDAGDYILFYGQGPDTYAYDTKSNFFSYQKNIYSDKNFYFLTISSSPGKRLGQSQNISGSYPIISQFDAFAYYETEKYNILHSGRQWYGEQFDQSTQLTIQFDIPGIVANSSIKLTSHVMGQTAANDCKFSVSFNSTSVLTQPIQPVPNSTFSVKGSAAADTVIFNESSSGAASKTSQQISYQFYKGSSSSSIGYLDYLLFSFKRKLAWYNEQTFFSSIESISTAKSTFQATSVPAGAQVWDVTNVFKTRNQSTQLDGATLSFSTNTDSLKRFVLFDPAKATSAVFDSKVDNQNLHAISGADLLIISHPSLLAEAARLADHRQSHNQLSVQTVTTDQVYNEYAGGKSDLSAIRDFVRDVYKKSNGQLKYVLLFGRGSYDYKNRVYNNTNLVPIYESYNSLDPLTTYSSDDYFGFLEDNEGAWLESPLGDHTLDVGIGRIPAKNLTDAQAVVDKLIDYDTNPDRFGPWRKDFLFVADDGDYNIHESQADQLANNIEQNHSEFNAKKFFLSSFKQVTKAIGQLSPDATKSLNLAIREGKALINYTGHGSERILTQEQILTPDFVQSLKNTQKYPLFVTATCEFGRNDDPIIVSSAELLLLQKNGGGIGLVTTARPVYSSTNFQLNQAFYQALFTKSNNQFRNLGAIMRDTKNNSVSGTSNRNFSLLGDPSMKLALEDNQVVATEVKTSKGSDTLKALSQVSIKGEVRQSGNILSNFNGLVYATLFDKIENSKTLGDPAEVVNVTAPAYSYTERSSIVFRGSASVVQGKFQIYFEMPNDLVQGINKGKLSLYAFEKGGTEATGYSTNFSVGGVETGVSSDNTLPEIKLFVSDTTFISGGTIGPNTQLVAQLFDENGITVSSSNPQNNIIATLDNKWSYTLNEFYLSKKDDFRKGMIKYPLDTLKKGAHTLTLSASDTHDNRGSATITFWVSDGTGIAIGDFGNYPNPFSSASETSFHFTHTHAGEDLEATLVIYDFAGKSLADIKYSIPISEYQVDLGKWDGKTADGTKISPGIYIARLFIRSLADGSQSEKAAKLIMVN